MMLPGKRPLHGRVLKTGCSMWTAVPFAALNISFRDISARPTPEVNAGNISTSSFVNVLAEVRFKASSKDRILQI